METLTEPEEKRVRTKLEQFMKYTQGMKAGYSYLVINRNSDELTNLALAAAHSLDLMVDYYDIPPNTPYPESYPSELFKRLRDKQPKGAMGLFDYSKHPEWNSGERPARLEMIHGYIEKIPISYAHAPNINLDMAANGALQCDYKSMVYQAQRMLDLLGQARKIDITAPGGTDISVLLPRNVIPDTDCTLIPPDVYGNPGKVGNIPVGEVFIMRRTNRQVVDKITGQTVVKEYPVSLVATGTLVCDVCVSGHVGRLTPDQRVSVEFSGGEVVGYKCQDPSFEPIFKKWEESKERYGLPIVLEEIGIGFNPKARPTGNMLESEKKKKTAHLAPAGIGIHDDMLFDKPTITVTYPAGNKREIMVDGKIQMY